MKKQILAVLLILTLLFALSSTVMAADQRVFDYSEVIPAGSELLLEETIASLREETGLDWVILTIDDAMGNSSRAVADSFYLANEFGVGADYSGALFLIDFDNQEIYISTCGKGIDYITDSRCEAIFDKCFDQVANGEYTSAAMTFLEEGERYVSMGVPKDHYYVDEETGEVTQYRGPMSIGMIIAFAIASAVIALVFRFGVSRGYSIKGSAYVYPFMNKSNLALVGKNDIFQNKFVSTRRIPRANNNGGGGGGFSSGGGGGSHVHLSGGRSFGGGGRKF
ncbi:MAG: TPM domain-containing protein [Oscillospiraceae bacterium]|nr:TPM domain-containing protein [Oscillospiraceae bacterium]